MVTAVSTSGTNTNPTATSAAPTKQEDSAQGQISTIKGATIMHGEWIKAEVACEGFQHQNEPSLVVYAIQHDGYIKMVGTQHGCVVEPPRAYKSKGVLNRTSVSASWDSAGHKGDRSQQVSNAHPLADALS